MEEGSRKASQRNEIMKGKAGKSPGLRGTLSTAAGGEDGVGSREQSEGGLWKQRRAENQPRTSENTGLQSYNCKDLWILPTTWMSKEMDSARKSPEKILSALFRTCSLNFCYMGRLRIPHMFRFRFLLA